MGRLIDADDFKKFLQALCKAGAPYEEVVQLLDKQPTAYDVSKVVADYEKQVEEVRHTVYSDNYLQNMSIQTIVINALFDLSEKIRKGGVE